MKHEWAAYVAFWICLCIVGCMLVNGIVKQNIEIQKTKQMELQLKCKG